jgi:hypothetical protein
MSVLARWGRLARVEATKVAGGRAVWFGLFAVVAVTALSAWLYDPVGPSSGWAVAARALSTGLWAAEIFVLVAGTTAIAGETDRGTLKMILPHAYRRSDWIAAKAIALTLQALVMLAAAIGAALVAGSMRGGLVDVTRTFDAGFGSAERVDVLHPASEMWSYLGTAAAVAAASLVATAWLGLLVSCVFDSVIPALSTGFLLFMGLKSAGTLFGAPSEWLEHVYSTVPGEMLDVVDKLARGFGVQWRSQDLARGARLAGMVGGVSLLGSLVVFSRRDLQS